MKAIFWAFTCLVFTAQMAFSQVPMRWQAGPEIGYAVTDFPWKREENGANHQGKETLTPKFNPMLGMRGTLLLGKHVLIGASLQYQLSGYNLRYQSETITDEFTVTQDIFHSQRYHKIAMPISLSFRFKVGSIHPFVGFGYRAAWINHVRFRGYYQTASPDSAGLNRHLPYDIGNFHPSQRAARQWVPQVMFTLGAEIGERLTVTLHAAAGSFGIPTPMNYYDQFRTYRNRELYATLAWRIW